MAEPVRVLAQLDRLVHAPPRLAILTALMACERADFTFLLNVTGLTKGNLSANLSRLEEAGLLVIEKELVRRVPHTTVRLTGDGLDTISAYWERLEQVRQEVVQWRPQGV